MAIPTPIQHDIRRLDRQGLSRAEIGRRLHVDRGTVAKYADMRDMSPKRPVDRRYGTKLDEFMPVVDGWPEADCGLPRKQRHTARRVYDRLVSEHGFTGSYSGVRRCVRRWREANRDSSDGFLDLEWAPGVMQVDFGVALAFVAGREVQVDWQRFVGLFLEGVSLLCELHRAQVSEGRVEPLVVVPPTTRTGSGPSAVDPRSCTCSCI